MSRIMLDAATVEKLVEQGRSLELCDENGKVIGYFSPKLDPAEWGPLEPQVSDEELQRRAESKGPWYTTAEVLAHLRKLDAEGR